MTINCLRIESFVVIDMMFNFNEGKKEFKATNNWAPSYPLFSYKDFGGE